MQLPKYFFVYVLFDPVTGVETHVVTGDNWTTLVRTKAFVESGVQVSRLLYLSNVKEGTHHERLARGEVPPQKKSPFGVEHLRPKPQTHTTAGQPLAQEEEVHRFVNAGVGLTPESRCGLCDFPAKDHPDMEIPLSVMARVRNPDQPAPCEDAFQGGAGGESGPHVAPEKVDVNDPEYGVGAHDITDFLTDEERRIRDAC